MADQADGLTALDRARERVLARGETWTDFDRREPGEDVIRYFKDGELVLERPRCPVINRNGTRCTRSLGGAHETCWNHRARGSSDV